MGLKVAVAHTQASPIEKDWPKQWAGLDSVVMAQFPTVVDWTARARKVVWIPALDWTNIVKGLSDAAVAAGQGGVVVLTTGHGGSDCMHNDKPVHGGDPEVGIVNFDPTEPPGTVRGWNAAQVGKGLFFNQDITRYTDSRPYAAPPSLKEEDEQAIAKKSTGWDWKQKRLEAFQALQKIGTALQANKVNRFTFTVCSAGASTKFLDRLAKQWKTEVACFRFLTEVYDDSPKARLVLMRDKATSGRGTNIPLARAASPDLDDASIAYVAHP